MNVALNIFNTGAARQSDSVKNAQDEQPEFDLGFAGKENTVPIAEFITVEDIEDPNLLSTPPLPHNVQPTEIPDLETLLSGETPSTPLNPFTGEPFTAPGARPVEIVNPDRDFSDLPTQLVPGSGTTQALVTDETELPPENHRNAATNVSVATDVPTIEIEGASSDDTTTLLTAATIAHTDRDLQKRDSKVAFQTENVAKIGNVLPKGDSGVSIPAAGNIQSVAETGAISPPPISAHPEETAVHTPANDKIDIPVPELADTAKIKTTNPVNFEAPKIIAEPALSGAAAFTAAPDNVTRVQQSINLTSLPPQAHPALQQVAETLIRAQFNQSGLSIRLDPPELGNVSIQFQFDVERNVTAIVRADVPETSALLRDKAEVLIQALKDNGFGSVDLSFEQGGSQGENIFDTDNTDDSYAVIPADKILDGPAAQIQNEHRAARYSDGAKVDLKL